MLRYGCARQIQPEPFKKPMRLTLKFAPPLILLMIGFALALVAQDYERAHHRLAEQPVEGIATVLSKKIDPHPGGSDKNKPTVHLYLVTYRLAADGGQGLEHTASFTRAFYDELKEGDQLPVTYRAGELTLHAFEKQGVLVDGSKQYDRGAGSLSYWIATGLAVLAVFWLLSARRFFDV